MKRILALAGAIFLLTGCRAQTAPPESGTLRMTIADTGKSDFILIQHDGFTVVNDAAYYETYGQVNALLKERGVGHIDVLILSHYDKDHIGGAADLIKDYGVDKIIMPDYFSGTEYWLNMVCALKGTDTEQLIITEDTGFTLGSAQYRISAAEKAEYDDENDFSLITELTYGETSFLLCGDALNERMGEFYGSLPENAHYDMIKTPHHGDYSSALGSLIEKTKPQYAVITCEADRETVKKKLLTALDNQDCETLFTCDGCIEFTSDGKTLLLTE